jgi:hypothetical protein
MTDDPTISYALAECGSTPVLLDLLCRCLVAGHERPGYDPTVRDTALAKAAEDRAFGESLNDAICLYLQRTTSGWDEAGPEFEPLLEMLAELKRPHSSRLLMDWIDRHSKLAAPTERQERRFALVVWTLMKIAPTDSDTFVAWWTSRVERHEGGWQSVHFDPMALQSD